MVQCGVGIDEHRAGLGNDFFAWLGRVRSGYRNLDQYYGRRDNRTFVSVVLRQDIKTCFVEIELEEHGPFLAEYRLSLPRRVAVIFRGDDIGGTYFYGEHCIYEIYRR